MQIRYIRPMILFKISNLKVRATKRYTNYDTNGFIINFTVFRVFKYRQIFDFISSVFFLRQQLGQKLDDIFCLKQQTLIGGIKMSHLNRIAICTQLYVFQLAVMSFSSASNAIQR